MDHDLNSSELSTLGESVGALRARRDMRALRSAQLSVMVGEAKSRIARQPKVQEFLEKLQEVCHQKSVGLYEELLSAVVQDVLPGEKNVALTLKTARGLPSLDVEMVKAGGERESVLEGSGGALTNILSAGLRVIALARSGAYPFLVLDEPDCWLKPTRVPQFANVIGQIAKDLEIQVLLISHHDSEFFSKFSSQVLLERRGGALVAKQGAGWDADMWTDAKSGIKELRLFDFMSHEKTVIPMSPGVTCLTGENDIGKSAIVSALRALFYGSGTDTSIAHGKLSFKVEAEFHDGSTLNVERYMKKSPKQRWRYFVPGQTEAVQDSSPKDGAPDWVSHIANIARTEDLDIAFANQKSPVFLLDQSPSRRASILAVGRESAHLQRLIAKSKSRNALDARMMRDGESEGAEIAREMALLESVDEWGGRVHALATERERLNTERKRISDSLDRLHRARSLKASLSSVETHSLSGIVEPKLVAVDGLSRQLSALVFSTFIGNVAISTEVVSIPVLSETRRLSELVTRFSYVEKISSISDISGHVDFPLLAETGVLIGALAKLNSADAMSSLRSLEPLPAPPHIEEMDSARSKLSALKMVDECIRTVGGSTMEELPRAPVLTVDAKAAASLDLLKILTVELDKLARYEIIGEQKKANLEAKRLELLTSVGGVCPCCSTPLSLDGLIKGAVHGHS